MKKRLLAGMLALTLVFSGSISVVAAEPAGVQTETSVDGILDESGVKGNAETTEETSKEEENKTEEGSQAEGTGLADILATSSELGETTYVINPIYAGEYTEEDLASAISPDGDSEKTQTYARDVYEANTVAEAGAAVKRIMKARGTVDFGILVPKNVTLEEIFRSAMEDKPTTAPNEGDYLRANWYGYRTSSVSDNTQVGYIVQIAYVDDAAMAAEVDRVIPFVLNSLNLTGKSEFEKIKTIHDYVCTQITYTAGDLVNHSTYGALVNGEAVCQGYASLFYRLCREAGISTRFITGLGGGEDHAWNIVKLGDYYYNLDATWDDMEERGISYSYFLLSDKDFSDHERCPDERDGINYASYTFYQEYPMAPVSYGAMGMQTNNLDYTFTKLDGTTVTSAASGKPKVLIFFMTTCGNSRYTIQSVSKSSWISKGVADVVAIEVAQAGKEAVQSFKDTYGCDAINFCYDSDYGANNALFAYLRASGNSSSSVTAPVIIYIDAENNIKDITFGAKDEVSIAERINIMTPSAGASFTDVPANSWYADAVDWAYVNGVMSGAGNNQFKPLGETNRCMVAQILYNISGKPQVTGAGKFEDVPSSAWYAEAVNWAAENGITSGVSATKFAPVQNITRQEMASLLYRYANKRGLNTKGKNNLSSFSDSNQISSWALEAMQWANNAGIINGKGSNNLDPLGTATRAEIVSMIRGFMIAYNL